MQDLSTTSESAPLKPSPRKIYLRIEADPAKNRGMAKLTERVKDQDKLVMFVPLDRVRPRLRKGETLAFFIGEVDAESGVLELGDRSPPEKEWDVIDPSTSKALPAETTASLPAASPPARWCPCGAPKHKELCRDAVAAMNGRRNANWKAPGMEKTG